MPLSRNGVDITIEQTINCNAKCQRGIVGFSRNYSAFILLCLLLCFILSNEDGETVIKSPLDGLFSSQEDTIIILHCLPNMSRLYPICCTFARY